MKTLTFFPLISSLLTGGNSSLFFPEYFIYYLLFTLGAFIVGGILGYFFAKMPNFDYKEEVFTLKQLLPCILLWGIIFSGIGFMVAHLFILSWIH